MNFTGSNNAHWRMLIGELILSHLLKPALERKFSPYDCHRYVAFRPIHYTLHWLDNFGRKENVMSSVEQRSGVDGYRNVRVLVRGALAGRSFWFACVGFLRHHLESLNRTCSFVPSNIVRHKTNLLLQLPFTRSGSRLSVLSLSP